MLHPGTLELEQSLGDSCPVSTSESLQASQGPAGLPQVSGPWPVAPSTLTSQEMLAWVVTGASP